MERLLEEEASRSPARTAPEPAREPSRIEALLELQRTHGNQAVQRLARSLRPAAGPTLQRKVVVTPDAYAAGHGNQAANFTLAQWTEYVRLAILDEWAYVRKHALANDYDAFLDMNSDIEVANSQDKTTTMAQRVDAIKSLIPKLNRYQDTKMTRYERNDPVPPNRETRYSSNPTGGYTHDRSGLTVRWQDDPDMWKQFGAAFGPIQPQLPTTPARGRDGQKPLSQLSWAQAKQMLPAPTIKLIFDVRFQLEADALGVVDERTADQKRRKVVSPNEYGTLRSYHQDSPEVLPANQFNAQNIPSHAQALHQHYTTNSQSGAGSSIQAGRNSPEGYAEYTAGGSNWEHNTKIVLDYINKRVYLTLSHYQYWALIRTTTGGYEMKVGNSQDPDQAQIQIQAHIAAEKKKSSNTLTDQFELFSPWVEILTT
jgi:hypothetical protein